MEKKKVHIISHSHWDREWYMPYEQFHMRLVELFDDLFELFENDPEFKSFHLDGQTIPLDDYLEVRPQNREKLKKYIQEGKLKIGPFYILQDAFLTSSEANARNTLVGLDESKKWGEPTMLGYFPDTFGNMGQAPQMMKQSGIDAVAYGRGVKTTGFDNVVVEEDFSSKYSEINWVGSDGTEAFSLLFANWYSNGNEIPVDKKEAKEFWDEKLADAERYASTRHLLMMNGVDHQPVQMDVSEAIRVANELYPDYEFVHSNFEDYVEETRKELPEDIGTVEGELRSQETDGWYTLANTASSHVHIKQKNTDVQNLLERITEPLATMAAEVSGEYPHDELRYAWKKLMQNHPHDSICACSVDEVHEGMMTRFQHAEEVGKFVRDEALRHLETNIDTTPFPKDSKPFVVFNTLGQRKTDTVEVEIEWERNQFDGRKPHVNYDELVEKDLPEFNIVDENGNDIEFDFVDTEVRFEYDLPKDAFRVPYMARYITVRLSLVDMPAFSWETFAVVASDKKVNSTNVDETLVMENDYMQVSINDDGSLDVMDKVGNKKYDDVMIFDNVGDVGNEYIFKQAYNDDIITSRDAKASVEVVEHTELRQTVRLTHHFMIPKSADDRLELEQKSVVEMRERKAERSDELIPFDLETEITLDRDSKVLSFKSHFDNQAKDHRLRVVFDSKLETEVHESESIYEIVERSNTVSDSWENPSNPQVQQAFSAIADDKGGIVVGNYGLNEYEVVDKRYIAVTLLRSVGELGDWGYFPTPKAQCLGKNTVEYSLAFQHADDKYDIYRDVKAEQIPFITVQTTVKEGSLAAKNQFLNVESNQGLVTALKRREHEEDVIVRLFNMSNKHASKVEISKENFTSYASDLIETVNNEAYDQNLKRGEIKTVRLKKGE